MDKLNISHSILSVSSPGTHLTPGDHEAARSLTRRVNAFGADLKRRRPDRFGFFAALPLPDVEGSVAEVEAAVKDGCDGFGVLSNHHGVYLGDPAFDPVFEAMNKHKAKLFVHPTAGCLCMPSAYPPTKRPEKPGSMIDGDGSGKITLATPLERYYAAPMMEFFFDTARAVANLFIQGVVNRFPDITYLIPHLGGCMPPLIYRFSTYTHYVPLHGADMSVNWDTVQAAFRERFYFDMAGWSMRGQVDGLLAGAGIGKDRLLFGSDYPFTKAHFVEQFVTEMDEGVAKWAEKDREDASWKSASGLFGLDKEASTKL